MTKQNTASSSQTKEVTKMQCLTIQCGFEAKPSKWINAGSYNDINSLGEWVISKGLYACPSCGVVTIDMRFAKK